MRRIRRKFSRKRAALGEAFGKPWEVVAAEWDRRPLSQDEIAEAWTALVSVRFPAIRFTQRNVSDILRLARELQPQRPADPGREAVA